MTVPVPTAFDVTYTSVTTGCTDTLVRVTWGGDANLGIAYAVAAIFGALEYTAVFLALSLVTSRALVVGLAYVVTLAGYLAERNTPGGAASLS